MAVAVSPVPSRSVAYRIHGDPHCDGESPLWQRGQARATLAKEPGGKGRGQDSLTDSTEGIEGWGEISRQQKYLTRRGHGVTLGSLNLLSPAACPRC